MKAITILLISGFMFGISIRSDAQYIQSIVMIPQNPTVNDTITVLATCSFSAGGCSDHSQFISIQGSNIYANALHCLGPLTVICTYTDTFKINPLPLGNYSFWFQVDEGQGPSPCTPGIVAGPSDSINFTVSLPVGINEISSPGLFSVYPNPAKEFIFIQLNENISVSSSKIVEIVSLEGKLLKTSAISGDDTKISISGLAPGIYFCHLKIDGKFTAETRFTITE